MQDGRKVLAQVYELLLGREVMNAVVEISRYDKLLAVQIMGLAVKSSLGDMPVE
jgi:hypothetical protein